jgi:ABC-type branched-subunit amino acid transport system ATPase component
VLDFGKLIASGATAAVLRDEAVIRAYLGMDS